MLVGLYAILIFKRVHII